MKALLALALLTTACADPEKTLERARQNENDKQAAAAMAAYENFLERWPKHEDAAEAVFRLARLHDKEGKDCAKAVPLYERAARMSGDWSGPARRALLTCPDFFPLIAGAEWTFVDSLSGGENMRLEIAVASSSGGLRGVMTGVFYAGETKFREFRREVVKENWGVWEERDSGRAPILRFPFRAGRSWTAVENGRSIRYEVVADALKVGVKAGEFSGCLKVKARTAGFPSWVFDYYCPGVGRVKTSVGVPGAENPNTELAAYKVPPSPAK